jgi:signal transduction histidine kinase
MRGAAAVSRAPRPVALAAGLIVLLVVLATLQYRWIGEVSRAERERMQTGLRVAAMRFARELDREIGSILFAFLPQRGGDDSDPGVRFARRYAEWARSSPDVRLVRDVWLVEPGKQGEAPLLARLDPEAQRFERADWPPDLEPLRRRVGQGRPRPIIAAIPALVVPLAPGPRLRDSETRPSGPPAEGVVAIRLDADRIVQMIGEMAERHFGDADGADYDLTVVRRTGDAQGVVYRSAGASDATHPADVSLPLLDFRTLEDIHDLEMRIPGPRGREPGPFRGRFGGRRHGRMGGFVVDPEPADWELRVTHRAGSLEAAVARVRARNLAIGLGTLLLLGVSVIFALLSAQRAQRLAEQQIEFVAAVSHEMHTPLAAIRSAGSNLADGVVREPAQVQQYGTMIETEGRRLSSMVAQALEFAGIQSGRQQYRMESVAVADAVEGALEDCRWTIEQRNAPIGKDLPADLPRLHADPVALRTAVRNLIDNALKYGDPAHGIELSARADGEVHLSVRDHGPGIAEADQRRIFDPFYRGQTNGARVQGSGLGLAVVRQVVQAHGGRVTFETSAQGTAFTLHLPVTGTNT